MNRSRSNNHLWSDHQRGERPGYDGAVSLIRSAVQLKLSSRRAPGGHCHRLGELHSVEPEATNPRTAPRSILVSGETASAPHSAESGRLCLPAEA